MDKQIGAKPLDFMREAIQEAQLAYDADEIPVGAVIVKDNVIIGRGHNMREALKDSTAHAEMLAIRSAGEHLKDWRLDDCTMYVTLEPCPMCSGAILQSRVSTLVFGAYDEIAGCCFSKRNIAGDSKLGSKCRIIGGMLEDECSAMLKSYFEELRR